MHTSVSTLVKKQPFLLFLLVEFILLFGVDRYYLNHAITLHILNNLNSANADNLNTFSTKSANAPCKHLYQSTSVYYRKQVHHENNTFHAFSISIGELFAHHLTLNETKRYDTMINNDLIENKYKKPANAPLSPHKQFFRKMYYTYYRDLHSPNSSNSSVDQLSLEETACVDFFAFINEGKHTNYTNHAKLNFYDSRPVEHVLDKRYRGGYSHKKLKNTSYFFPRLFSYTLSMHPVHDLKSLEFRFVEIIDVLQHDATRHILLNNLKDKLLWAGEFWFIYDHKYKKYMLIMDASSGHFKPDINAKPSYLEHLLIRSLFPYYNDTNVTKHEYHPLTLIGHQASLWHYVKQKLFPVNHLIHLWDSQKKVRRKKEERKIIKRFLKSAPCNTMIDEKIDRIMSKYANQKWNFVSKYIRAKMSKFKIECDATVNNVTVIGWSEMTQEQERELYKLLKH